MVVADIVALSQFRILRHQIAEVSRIDQTQVAVLRVHTDLLSFRDKLRPILASQDAEELASEANRLRDVFLEDVSRAKQALSVASSEIDPPRNTVAILESVEGALPTQIDTLKALAENGDWEAASLRFDNQLQALGTIAAALVDQVEADVTRQRAVALQHIDRVQQWFFVLLPVTAILTLATAGTLGVIVTRSITRPLTMLVGATQALGHGDFRHEVPVTGTDELARLAATFNYASQELQTPYDALSSSELRFRSLIEHSSDLITTLDKQGNIRYVSPSSKRVIGYKPEQLHGNSFFDFVHPEDVATAQAVFGREPVETVEFRFRHADGTMRILEAAGRNLLAVSEVAGIVVNARDITARRRAEEALYQSEKKYRAFFEQNAAASYISKPDGRLVACNPAFLRMFGFSRLEELEGSNLAELYPHPSAREHVLRQLEESGYVENYQQEYRRQDGKPLFAVANAFGRFDTKGELVEICGFLIDETLRRRTEEQLRQAQKIEAVGRLAGAVAHDFNNLLGVIIGYGQMLLEDPKTPPASRPYIEQIFKAGVMAAI
jgi:PAS domain S-box-containing protein